MKKIFTLLFVVSVIFSYGQRTKNQAVFSQTNTPPTKKLKQYRGEKSTNLNIVWQETFDDSIATGVNGLPNNFSYTPNSTIIDDQWQYQGESPDGYIGRGWYANVAISETFYTDAHTVPTNNPALYVDFTNSFYWMIEQGSDSLCIYYSIDGGSSYTILWSNRDQTLVEASGVAWPYPSWVWQTARIQLPLTTIGQDISFKFTFEGSTANGIYVDNIMLVEIPNYDIEMTECAVLNSYLSTNDTVYLDGLYQLLPIDQKRNFVDMRASVKNYGMQSANNILYSTSLTDASGTVVAQKDTNYMQNGQDLTNFLDIDMFACQGFDNIDNVDIGTYTLTTNLSFDNVDEDTLNNIFSIDIEYTYESFNGLLARNTDITGELGLHQYDGSADGDQIGINFTVLNEITTNGAIIPIGPSTTDNTGFTLRLYKWDGSAWQQIAFSDDVYTTSADAGTNIDVDYLNPVTLCPGEEYRMVVSAHWTAGTSKITFGIFNEYKDFLNQSLLYAPASALNIGGTWYYITNIPCFYVKFATITRSTRSCAIIGSVTEDPRKDIEISVYPNPTNGIVNIDIINAESSKIEVYNILGNLVLTEYKQYNLDLSNLKDGQYIIKVYTETGIAVKKLNLQH